VCRKTKSVVPARERRDVPNHPGGSGSKKKGGRRRFRRARHGCNGLLGRAQKKRMVKKAGRLVKESPLLWESASNRGKGKIGLIIALQSDACPVGAKENDGRRKKGKKSARKQIPRHSLTNVWLGVTTRQGGLPGAAC